MTEEEFTHWRDINRELHYNLL